METDLTTIYKFGKNIDIDEKMRKDLIKLIRSSKVKILMLEKNSG